MRELQRVLAFLDKSDRSYCSLDVFTELSNMADHRDMNGEFYAHEIVLNLTKVKRQQLAHFIRPGCQQRRTYIGMDLQT